ncbi:MAG: PRC-barrel domain-containing protein [Gammaproteobacteria bacterium]|nr:PRC-barrel domain-containing protein [Gammaproteobacteria bacterium]
MNASTAALLGSLICTAAVAADEAAVEGGVAYARPSQVVFLRQQTDRQFLARKLLDRQVLNPHAENLGRVHDVVLDRRGEVIGLVVSVGGFLGLGDKLVGLPWHDVTVRHGGKFVVVNLSREQLVGAPEYRSWQEAARRWRDTAPPPAMDRSRDEHGDKSASGFARSLP